MLGRRILIVYAVPTSSCTAPITLTLVLSSDEVDDSRTTLGYAVSELKKDIAEQLAKLPEDKRASTPETKLAVFVVHNKLKEKRGTIPDDVQYFAGQDVRFLGVFM